MDAGNRSEVSYASAGEADHDECYTPAPDEQIEAICRAANLSPRSTLNFHSAPMKKLRVGILFGGRSGEHEVSLLSAASVLQAMDQSKYDVHLIGITKDGRWLTAGDAAHLLPSSTGEPQHLRAGDPEATPGAALLEHGKEVWCSLCPLPLSIVGSSLATLRTSAEKSLNVDVIFPVLHGTFGEDGTVQGLLELADIAYVGSGVLGSSAGMDKDVMKRLFAAAKLPIPKHVTLLRGDWRQNPRRGHAARRGCASLSHVCEARESGLLRWHQQGS